MKKIWPSICSQNLYQLGWSHNFSGFLWVFTDLSSKTPPQKKAPNIFQSQMQPQRLGLSLGKPTKSQKRGRSSKAKVVGGWTNPFEKKYYPSRERSHIPPKEIRKLIFPTTLGALDMLVFERVVKLGIFNLPPRRLPSRGLTYPTLGSWENHRLKIAIFGGYVSSLEGKLKITDYLKKPPLGTVRYLKIGVYPPGNGKRYPSHLWKRNIIDSKLPFQGDMLVSGSVSVLSSGDF